MKFSISKNSLQTALGIVLKGTSTRSTLPVLSGILMEAKGDELIFNTTNLELSIRYATPALIEEEGKAVLPGKLFNDIVKNLPDAAVNVSADNASAHIICDTASFEIRALDPEDFPAFPEVSIQQSVKVPFEMFSSMVRRVARFVSKDESHPILTGVLIKVEDDMLKMVATDSYRLAATKMALNENQAEEFEAVVSGNFLLDIIALPKTEEMVTLALAENQIVITYQNTVFINRRIEGNFPNYKQLLPNSFNTRVCIDTDRMSSAVRRTSLLGSTTSPLRIDVSADGSNMQFSTTSQDVGSVKEILDCDVEGNNMQIAFNNSYLLEGLSSVESETVYLDLQDTMKPGILRTTEGDSYLYLIMPVRIS